jgi:hypothetical protein
MSLSMPPSLHTFLGSDSQLRSVTDSFIFTELFCNERVFHTFSMVAVEQHAGFITQQERTSTDLSPPHMIKKKVEPLGGQH